MAGSELKADLWINEYITPWDIYSHGVTRVLAYKRTAFQEMYIVETGAYGKALVLDGKWQSCTGDEFLYHEALVQPALICHQAPKRVLILGGGEGATAREVLRWKTVEQVLMVDIDLEVVDACQTHLPEMHQQSFEDPRFQLYIGDALTFLDETTEQWDVVISDLSDPIEEGPSFQLFTQEYFQKIARVLATGGFFVVQAGPVAPAELTLHARLTKTVGTVFENVHSYHVSVPTYAAAWGFVLGSAATIGTRPEPEVVDRLLAEKTTGGLRLLDGVTFLGLMQTPAYVRHAIAAETKIYTLKRPPKFGESSVE